jgi:hypothetical protein
MESSPLESTYMAASTDILSFKKSEVLVTNDGEASPCYDVWNLPKPPALCHKDACPKPPPVPVFKNAGEALNPVVAVVTTNKAMSKAEGAVPPPLPPRRRRRPTTADSAPLLPQAAFVNTPSSFLISPEHAYKHVARSEHQSAFKYDRENALSARQVDIRKSGTVTGDVSCQKVFTARQARAVYKACLADQDVASRKPVLDKMASAGARVAKELGRRKSVSELKERGVIKQDESHGCATVAANADAAARVRNSSVEITRMLDTRPKYLPSGRNDARKKDTSIVEKSLQKRTDIDVLQDRNIHREVCEVENNTDVMRRRMSSVDVVKDLLVKKMDELAVGGDVNNKENPSSKPRVTKKTKQAIIPLRTYASTMNNTNAWSYGDKYIQPDAINYRNVKKAQGKRERVKVHRIASEAKAASSERFFGKYGKREINAVRYKSKGVVADRKWSVYKKDFVWHDCYGK